MAVYTEVSFEDLEVFLAEYDLGAPLSFKGIAKASRIPIISYRRARLVHPHALRKARAGGRPALFPGTAGYLAARGIACPLPVRSRNGAHSVHLNGRPAPC